MSITEKENKITQKRSSLFSISMLLTAILSVPFVTGSIMVGNKFHKHYYHNEIIKSSRNVGLTLIPVMEKELLEKTKQEIVELLELVYAEYPLFSGYKKDKVHDISQSKEKDCIYYGGTYFVFRDEKFAFFDTKRLCDDVRYIQRFYKEDLGK